MWASFKYSLLQLIRVPGVLIWTLVFPIVLGSLFVMMLGALDERAEAVSVNVVVVDEEQAKGEERTATSFEDIASAAQVGARAGGVFDEEAFGAQAFATFMETLGEGDGALFDITYVSSPEEAAALVRESLGTDDEYAGYVQYVDGEVRTVLAKATSAAEAYEVEPSILMMIMDRYVAEEALIKEALQKNPAALANPGFIETLMAPVEATVRASVTDNAPRESLRYYFALFGMAAFFGASIGLIGFQQIRANASALAARRSLGAFSHGKTAFVTLLASWLLSFASRSCSLRSSWWSVALTLAIGWASASSSASLPRSVPRRSDVRSLLFRKCPTRRKAASWQGSCVWLPSSRGFMAPSRWTSPIPYRKLLLGWI